MPESEQITREWLEEIGFEEGSFGLRIQLPVADSGDAVFVAVSPNVMRDGEEAWVRLLQCDKDDIDQDGMVHIEITSRRFTRRSELVALLVALGCVIPSK
jgi:hypothetical protein